MKDNDGNVSSEATVNVDVASAHILTSVDDVFSGDSLQLWTEGTEVYGGAGHDYIVTSNSKSLPDTVYGGDGNDLIFTGGGNDYVEGGNGDDVIHARGGTDTVIGGAGDDVYVLRIFGHTKSATTDTGTTTITDDDGVLWNGTYQPASIPASWSPAPGATAGYGIAGTATFVSPGVCDLAVADDNGGTQHLTLNWTGGDLTIIGGNQTVVIEDYVNGTFGIVIPSEVMVTGGGVFIADGDTTPDAGDDTAFGTHAVGAVVERTFTVTNNGDTALKLSGLKLPSGFKLAKGENLASTLAPGASDTFKVVLDTKKVGDYSGVISFKTNNSDVVTFDFVVSATVAAPEIDVSGNGINIRDNDNTPSATDHTNFGSAGVWRRSYDPHFYDQQPWRLRAHDRQRRCTRRVHSDWWLSCDCRCEFIRHNSGPTRHHVDRDATRGHCHSQQ